MALSSSNSGSNKPVNDNSLRPMTKEEQIEQAKNEVREQFKDKTADEVVKMIDTIETKKQAEKKQKIADSANTLTHVINEFFSTEDTYRKSIADFYDLLSNNFTINQSDGTMLYNTPQGQQVKLTTEQQKEVQQIIDTYKQLKTNPFDIAKKNFETNKDPFATIREIQTVFFNDDTFIKSHQNAVQVANNTLRYQDFFKKNNFIMQNHGKPVNDLSTPLTTPVQRAPRYVLLTTEMAKHIIDERKSECYQLVEKAKSNTVEMNEAKRKNEVAEALVEINQLNLTSNSKEINDSFSKLGAGDRKKLDDEIDKFLGKLVTYYENKQNTSGKLQGKTEALNEIKNVREALPKQLLTKAELGQTDLDFYKNRISFIEGSLKKLNAITPKPETAIKTLEMLKEQYNLIYTKELNDANDKQQKQDSAVMNKIKQEVQAAVDQELADIKVKALNNIDTRPAAPHKDYKPSVAPKPTVQRQKPGSESASIKVPPLLPGEKPMLPPGKKPLPPTEPKPSKLHSVSSVPPSVPTAPKPSVLAKPQKSESVAINVTPLAPEPLPKSDKPSIPTAPKPPLQEKPQKPVSVSEPVSSPKVVRPLAEGEKPPLPLEKKPPIPNYPKPSNLDSVPPPIPDRSTKPPLLSPKGTPFTNTEKRGIKKAIAFVSNIWAKFKAKRAEKKAAKLAAMDDKKTSYKP